MPEQYCQGVTRKQAEATAWGDAHIGCSRYGIVYDEKVDAWFCRQHSDPRKRYGINPQEARHA